MRLPIGSVLIIFSCWLNSQTVCGQGTVQTTVQDNFPIEIPTSPFNDSDAIHAQQDRFRAEGQILDYGVKVATKAKTSLSDFQTRLNQAIAANSYKGASQILLVAEQTFTQAQTIDAQIFRFSNNKGSPAYNDHMAADADLAAARQTLAQMEAAIHPLALKELAAAMRLQAAQDDQLRAAIAVRQADEKAWDDKITAGLGELAACFGGTGTPPASAVNCNVFVGRTLQTLYGFSDFKNANGNYKDANTIADFVAASPNWTLIGTANNQTVLDQAANSASSHPVVAVWKNPALNCSGAGEPCKDGHGHVVLIGPGPELASPAWAPLLVPNYAGFSEGNKAGPRRIGDKLSWGFGNDVTKSSIKIYVRRNS